jgi:hypothetical protein
MRKKFCKKALIKIIILIVLVFAIEMISYFVIAEYFGEKAGVAGTHNLAIGIDKIIPWFSPFYPFYIIWPIIWFVALPTIIYFASGKNRLSQYFVNAFFIYIIGSVIYAIFPTTTVPADFINQLPTTAPFYNELVALSQNHDNIWGSFPSYHNYWASLLIFFALFQGTKNRIRIPMILVGILITLSTLFLHQHCVFDVILTYAMTGLFLFLTVKFKLDIRLEKWIFHEIAFQ